MEAKLIGFTFLLGVISHLALDVLSLRGKDVNFGGSIYTILSFLTLSLLYDHALKGRYRKIIFSIAVAFCVFAIINLLFIQQDDINSYSKTLKSIIFLGYSIFYYYRLLVELPVQHLQRMPMFWFNASLLLYNSGTLFLFVFTSYLVEVLHNDLLIYWSFHNILNLIQHFVVMIGLWQDLRNIKSHSS